MSRVDLGFVEKADSWLLKSNQFPSKVGGKPAWLNLKELPNTEDFLCKKCNQPMVFLCQVYAPVEDQDSCFHRTIFVFVCRQESCCHRNDNNNLIVWRNQLKRHNEFYPPEPPADGPNPEFNIENFSKICAACGIPSSKHCSKCKTVSYCSREHQVADWKAGHKNLCGTHESVNNSKVLFEEMELVIEAEDDSKTETESAEEAEQRRLREYENLVAEGKTGTMADISESELESHAAVDEDKVFSQFRKKIAANPDQVLRYDRGGEPLWIAIDPKPTEIPNCEICNSPRQFEFQILPQILYSLHENVLDWGTLIIYTCKANCDSGPAYKKEYIFKQDVSTSK